MRSVHILSNVTPAGTVRVSKIIVEQEALDLLADEYPRDPEKEHVAARFSMARSSNALSTSSAAGAAVGIGAATGEALHVAARKSPAKTLMVVGNMIKV